MSKCKASIGGQALIEGIMMKGPNATVLAVRHSSGEILVEPVVEKHLKDKFKFFGLPLVRGMVNFIEAMVVGYKTLMRSADLSGFTELEVEQSKKEKKNKKQNLAENEQLGCENSAEIGQQNADENAETSVETPAEKPAETTKMNTITMSVVMIFSAIFGVGLAVLLFMFLPTFCFNGINHLANGGISRVFQPLIEGLIRLVLFLTYIFLVTFEPDIKRVFMYHGAEHKSIFCYEQGLPLTVENIRIQSRFHPRCGTSFMFLMIIVGIIIGIIAKLILPISVTSNTLIWVLIKILLIPVTCGFGYELLKVCGKHTNTFTKIVSAPGLWVQRITTKEPDDKMIEVAIASILPVVCPDESFENCCNKDEA